MIFSFLPPISRNLMLFSSRANKHVTSQEILLIYNVAGLIFFVFLDNQNTTSKERNYIK